MKKHLGQFALYIVSGSAAAVMDLGSYLLFLHLDIWYLAASVMSSVLGFITAFLLHKYIVFKKTESFKKHLGRYFVVDIINTIVSTLLLFAFVEWFGIGEEIAKVIAMGSVVLWNFFIYKFVVYV